MISISNLQKSIGQKDLFKDLNVEILNGDKSAIIGRNGLGKTTFFRILSNEDSDYLGLYNKRKGLRVILTKQEHFLDENITPLEYILADVPKFFDLYNIIKSDISSDLEKIQEYTDAISEFSSLGYYDIENKILGTLESFQITEEQSISPMKNLSGGEKRFVELTRLMYSQADLLLIDEPTNHMDYVGKAKFIEWLEKTDSTVMIISHDRDVLHSVSKIYELKDHKFHQFKGNYDKYLAQNSVRTVTSLAEYESNLRELEGLKKQMLDARTRKLEAKTTPGRMYAKTQEERFTKLYEELKEKIVKPSFWIDEESLENVSEKVIAKYDKYKEKNINIHKSDLNEYQKVLLKVQKLSLGYKEALFKDISFDLSHGERIFIKGRNGAGKSTFVKTLVSIIKNEEPEAIIFSGSIKTSPDIRLGVYEQEVNQKFLEKTLGDCVTDIYYDAGKELSIEARNGILGRYLFDPINDSKLTIDKLSGGQKARLQLIKMMVRNPNLLILDEPTNHLDLPSIEEIENLLADYKGAIIYISHDNFFIKKIGGKIIEMD